jgi:hypothetical protein
MRILGHVEDTTFPQWLALLRSVGHDIRRLSPQDRGRIIAACCTGPA